MTYHNHMTAEEIEALRELEHKAFPAPWVAAHEPEDGQASYVIKADGFYIALCHPLSFRPGDTRDEANAAFIAAARNAVPCFIATIDAREHEIARLTCELGNARAENAKLRAALRGAADALSGVLLHGLPKPGRSADERDAALGEWDGLVVTTQLAYAVLAGVSLAKWTAEHPGIYDSPPGPIRARALLEQGGGDE